MDFFLNWEPWKSAKAQGCRQVSSYSWSQRVTWVKGKKCLPVFFFCVAFGYVVHTVGRRAVQFSWYIPSDVSIVNHCEYNFQSWSKTKITESCIACSSVGSFLSDLHDFLSSFEDLQRQTDPEYGLMSLQDGLIVGKSTELPVNQEWIKHGRDVMRTVQETVWRV